jgi:hypothetical protein
MEQKTVAIQTKYIECPTELFNNICDAVAESQKLSIVTDAHVDKAAFYIKKYKQLKKEIEQLRKTRVDPLNKEVKLINADYKAIINAFEFEPERLGSELTDFMRQKRKLEEIEQAKEQKELDDALIKEAEVFNDESVLDDTAKVEIKRERLDTTHLTTMRVKRWRLIDFDKVPRKYLLLDEVALNKIRKADEFDAVSNIPGIEFYTDEVART